MIKILMISPPMFWVIKEIFSEYVHLKKNFRNGKLDKFVEIEEKNIWRILLKK